VTRNRARFRKEVAVSLLVTRLRRSFTLRMLCTWNHHDAGTQASSVRMRSNDRVILVRECPTGNDGGSENEGHQYL
jgi:hypothetical protein